jgi:hypothetical protein
MKGRVCHILPAASAQTMAVKDQDSKNSICSRGDFEMGSVGGTGNPKK